MTEGQAIATASEAAEAAGAILADFDSPKSGREEASGEWFVFYQGKKLLVGNHFMVVVDDGTGQVRLVPGTLGETCTVADCQGAAIAGGSCVAHLDGEQLETWLAAVGKTGDLDARGASLSKALLQRLVEAAPLGTDGRRWLRRVRFDDATFEGDALFDEFTFEEEASFAGASFRGHARFGTVRFDGPAAFTNATFTTHAWFMGTTFGDDASFEGAKFEGPAWFGQAVFDYAANFDSSSFSADFLAPDTKFRAGASFADTRFARKVRFDDEAFDQEPVFDGAVFEQPAEMPASVKAEAKRLANERAPETSDSDEALPPPPTRKTPLLSRRRSLRSVLPGVALGLVIAVATLYVIRDDGTRKANFVPFARGEESAFRFLLKDEVTGRPVRYNPCQVLRYVVNPELGPEDWRPVVRDAIREVTRATGIKFEFEGVTNEVVRADLEAAIPNSALDTPAGAAAAFKAIFNRPSYQPERYGADRWAPILIGWAVLGDTPPDERVEVLGVGASDPRTFPSRVENDEPVPSFTAYVSGEAVINTNVRRQNLKTALMHELGHVLGLAHIVDKVAIMQPNVRSGAPVWSAGDLSGLRKVGRSVGCLPAAPPPGP